LTPSKRSDDWDFDRPARKYEEEDNHYARPKPSRDSSTAGASAAAGDEAQKKFGGAKAISSDQFFSGASDNDVRKTTAYQIIGLV
jgi:hypothetical protein